MKEFPINDYFDRIGHRGEPFDLAVVGWYENNTDPAQDLDTFDGSTITADANQNFSYLNDPAFDRQLHAAAALSGARRYRTYSQLELELEPRHRAGGRIRDHREPRHRAGGRIRDHREPRLLLRPDGLPARPAGLRNRPGRAMPPEHRELTAICFRDVDIPVYTASSAGARCAMLGGGGIGEHEARSVTGGGGIEEHEASAVFGGGGTDEQDASAVAGGGGIGEDEASAVTGGGIEERPCAVLGGGISDPGRAGRRSLADVAWFAPDSISL